MGLRDLKHRAGTRLQEAAPGLHRFLTREDKPWPAVRDFLGIIAVLVVLGLVLWVYTGQTFPDPPVVVVESGSMMHCDQGHVARGARCEGPFGRLGTIDAGDLIFIQDVGRRGDVETFLGSQGGGREGYGMAGDVIVFSPNGALRTPIIHRAMFWLEVNDNGSFTIPEWGRTYADAQALRDELPIDHESWRTRPGCELDLTRGTGTRALTPADSGFITMGDNNECFDQGAGGNGVNPVRPEWILGKARGEIPWIGVVKLQLTDWFGAGGNVCPDGGNVACHVPGDVKFLTWATVFVLLGLPFVAEQASRAMQRRGGHAHPTRPAGGTRQPRTAMALAAFVPGAGGLYAGSPRGFVKGFISQAGAIILFILAFIGSDPVFILVAFVVLAVVVLLNVLHAQDLADDYNARPEA